MKAMRTMRDPSNVVHVLSSEIDRSGICGKRAPARGILGVNEVVTCEKCATVLTRMAAAAARADEEARRAAPLTREQVKALFGFDPEADTAPKNSPWRKL